MRYTSSAEAVERPADQPHQGDAAGPEGQAAAPTAQSGEGGWAVQVLQAGRPKHQDQGYASVSNMDC